MGAKKIFSKFSRKILNLYRREVLRDEPLLEAKRWFRDCGDTRHRLNYALSPDSVVVDLGGYIGDFAEQINSRYGSTVYLFEPVPSFYSRCVTRFANNNKIHSYCYGLGASAGYFPISDDADASSFLTSSASGRVSAEMRPVVESFESLGITSIDLLKINIEGGEYEVLSSLINGGWVKRIRNIQVQFHTVGEDYEGARNDIREKLKNTHRETWCYKFVWENWVRL